MAPFCIEKPNNRVAVAPLSNDGKSLQEASKLGSEEPTKTAEQNLAEAKHEESPIVSNGARLFPSIRLLFSIVGMLGTVCVACMSNCTSVALICMTSNSSSSTGSASNVSYASSYSSHSEISSTQEGEFNWSRDLQGWILSSFFIGAASVRVVAGILSNRFGGRRVGGAGVVSLTLLTILTPVFARAHVALLITGQVLKGISAGMYVPSFYAMLGLWAPPDERGFLLSIFMIGMPLGTVLGSVLTGLLCESSFAGGWPGIFYTFGMTAAVWCVVWFFTGFSCPEEHPRISPSELKYIQDSLPSINNSAKKPKVPWRQILTTPAVYAVFLATISWGWSWYTALTSLPQYLLDVLELDIKQNGLINALPYIANSLISTPASLMVGAIVSKKVLSLKWARKLAETISLVSAAAFALGIGFITKDQMAAAVVLLTLWVGLLAFSNSGSWCIFVDMAPRFVGVIKGMDATLNTLPGILAPVIVGVLTPNRTASEWRVVFFLCTGIALFGWLVFVLLSTTDEQPWAKADQPEDSNPVNESYINQGFQQNVEGGSELHNIKPNENEKTIDRLKNNERNRVAPHEIPNRSLAIPEAC